MGTMVAVCQVIGSDPIKNGKTRKKPEYNAEMIMNDFIKNVAECYENSSKASFRDVATEFDITLLKVRKVLVTAGVYAHRFL